MLRLKNELLVGVWFSLFALLVHDFRSSRSKLKLQLGLLNITSKCNDSAVIFNRVPKVGSMTMNHLIENLSRTNHFEPYTSLEGMPFLPQQEVCYFSLEQQQNMKDAVTRQLEMSNKPMAFMRHFNFLDFGQTKKGPFRPIYINFVRDPVERVISWYYYIRNPTYLFKVDERLNTTTYEPNTTIKLLKTSLEDCINMGRCRFITGMNMYVQTTDVEFASQMSFFCGHDPQCYLFNDEHNFRTAVRNVEENYAVVGLAEEYEKSLFVMEKLVPKFFSGAMKAYKKSQTTKHNYNLFKPAISDQLRQMLARNFTKEIEFYNFCKQRLHKQYLLATLMA